jgi:hypothetical protein
VHTSGCILEYEWKEYGNRCEYLYRRCQYVNPVETGAYIMMHLPMHRSLPPSTAGAWDRRQALVAWNVAGTLARTCSNGPGAGSG